MNPTYVLTHLLSSRRIASCGALVALAALPALAAGAGCSSSSSTTTSSASSTTSSSVVSSSTSSSTTSGSSTASTSSSSTSGGGSSTSSTASTGTTGSDAGTGGAIALPFDVSTVGFIPSGYFWDNMSDPSGITMTSTCTSRAPTQGGDCFTINWTYAAGNNYAGVFWQYPANNFGTEPGLDVAAGAKEVSFYAKGAVGGEQVQFLVGGINTTGTGGSFMDGFSAKSAVISLTNAWATYSIPITGDTYAGGVIGAFGWVAAVGNDGGANNDITFYIDDLQWQ